MLSDAESFLAAVRFLEKARRTSSVLPLTLEALERGHTLPILDKVFDVALEEGHMAAAVRAMVKVEHLSLANQEGRSRVLGGLKRLCHSPDFKELVPVKTARTGVEHFLSLPQGVRLVGYFGPADEHEEFDVLIQACEALRSGGVDLRLLVIGGAGRSALDDWRVRNGAFGVGAEAEFLIDLGGVSLERLVDCYRLCDLSVVPHNPRLHDEFVPSMKVIEGLLHGQQLVVSDADANSLLAQTVGGVAVYRQGDVQSMCQAISGLFSLAGEHLGEGAEPRLAKAAGLWGLATDAKSPAVSRAFEAGEPLDVKRIVGQIRRLVERREGRRTPFFQGRVLVVGDAQDRAGGTPRNAAADDLVRDLHAAGHDVHVAEAKGAPWFAEAESPRLLEVMERNADNLMELFRESLPEVVVAVGDYRSALPAHMAARSLGIPVIKRHLHYAEEFLRRRSEGDESVFRGFDEEYSLEQLCFSLAERIFYLHPDDPDAGESLSSTIRQAIGARIPGQVASVLQFGERVSFEFRPECAGVHGLAVNIEDQNGGIAKGAAACFTFFDEHGELLDETPPGFLSIEEYPACLYVDTSADLGNAQLLLFALPEGIGRIEVDIVVLKRRSHVTVSGVEIRSLDTVHLARWVGERAPSNRWLADAVAFATAEGALSLRLAVLQKKHRASRHRNDLRAIHMAVQEMVELDRDWLPEISALNLPLPRRTVGPLKVMHLHKTAYPYESTGGAIRCLNTVLSQQRLGIEPFIVTPAGYPASTGCASARDRETIKGVNHFRIGADTEGIRSIAYPDQVRFSTFHMATLLRREGADVIHAASGARGYELAVKALALKKMTGLPVLYEVRSFHEHTWSELRDDVLALEKTQLRTQKEDFCMAEADFVTTISQSMKKILIARGVPPEKIEVIPNAIDEEKYLGLTFQSARHPKLDGADVVVGYISNMSRREGHAYLLRAIRILRETTGRDIRGLLVGDGPEREALENLAEELGLTDVVAFPGAVDHDEINGYYKAIDLFVIPRIPDYAADWVTPLKPYEAMALECPLIVSDLPALKEIIGENEERGLLARPGDADDLAHQLRRYIDDPQLLSAKVEAARDWVFAERTWSANAIRYEGIYKRLLAQAGTIAPDCLEGARNA